MQRSELEHLLRAAGETIDERQFIVIGSQSIRAARHEVYLKARQLNPERGSGDT